MTKHEARDFESSAYVQRKAADSHEYLNVISILARRNVLTVVLLRNHVFCDVTPCQLVNSYRRFEGP
jgi:hypothetical protein